MPIEVSGTAKRRHPIGRAVGGAAVVLGMAVVLAACGSSSSSSGSGSTLDRIKSSGTVTIGYDNDPPWSFRTSSGQLTGLAAQVAEATFKEMGIPNVKGELVSFGDLIPGVGAGRFDSIGDSLFITPDRCKQVLFSDPFAVDGEALAVQAGNPKNLSDFKSVAQAGATLGIVSGSAESSFAADAGVPSGDITTFSDVTTAIDGLNSGRVDAVAYDVVALEYTVKQSGADVEVAKPFTATLNGKPQYGANAFIFRKSDASLRDAFNEAQAKLIKSGKVAGIAKKFVSGLGPGIQQAQHLSVSKLCAGA